MENYYRPFYIRVYESSKGVYNKKTSAKDRGFLDAELTRSSLGLKDETQAH